METTIVATYTTVHAAAAALPDAAIVLAARMPWESWCGIKEVARKSQRIYPWDKRASHRFSGFRSNPACSLTG